MMTSHRNVTLWAAVIVLSEGCATVGGLGGFGLPGMDVLTSISSDLGTGATEAVATSQEGVTWTGAVGADSSVTVSGTTTKATGGTVVVGEIVFSSPGDLKAAADDSTYRDMKSWVAFADEGERRANGVHTSRTVWKIVLNLAKFGGAGAAALGSGVEDVDVAVGVGGALAVALAQLLDLAVVSDNQLKRQTACEKLWSQRATIEKIASDYRVGLDQHNDAQKQSALKDFDMFKATVRPLYTDCITRT